MGTQIFTFLLGLFGGAFCIYAAKEDWDWFFEHYRVRPIVKLFGREGARKFYTGLGIFLIVVSLLLVVY